MDSNQKNYEIKWYENLGIQILKQGNVPQHIAFIMDGNRRFAQQLKLPKVKGHEQGFQTLLKCLIWCQNLGVKICTIFAFSIENYNREKTEVDYLMNLAGKQLKELAQNKNFFQANEIQIKICGDLSLCNEEIRNSMRECEELTKDNQRLKLNVCFSYNFTNELEHSMKVVSEKYDLTQVTQTQYESFIMDNLMIDNEPDLLVRTSNEVNILKSQIGPFEQFPIALGTQKHSNIIREKKLATDRNFRFLQNDTPLSNKNTIMKITNNLFVNQSQFYKEYKKNYQIIISGLMQDNIYYEDLGVLKCANDYKIQMKRLKIKAFGLFHKCQFNCVNNINTDNTEMCFKSCEGDLDSYFEFKKKFKFQNTVFYALPRYENSSEKKNYIVPESEQFEYQKRCISYEKETQLKLKNLGMFLDEQEKKYLVGKKK